MDEAEEGTYYEIVSGEVHHYDMISGELLNKEDIYGFDPDSKQLRLHGYIRKPTMRFSAAYADVICAMLEEGETITAICNKQGMPSISTFNKWRAENPNFADRVKLARKCRAELYTDKIVAELDEPNHTPAEVSDAKLKFEKLKHLAAVNDPDTYGNKVQHGGNKDNPIVIQVDTGIRRINEDERKSIE